tara:strand:- start:50 stop:568 length:519 start_codon:yes stop_codon:yes gene_type:complete
MQAGNAYRLTTKSGRTRDIQYVSYDPVAKRDMVRVLHVRNTNPQEIKLGNFSTCRPIRKCNAKQRPLATTRAAETRLYLLKTGTNIYKIGCSSNVQERMRSGRTWCPMMQLVATRKVPTSKVLNWRTHEQQVKDEFKWARCPDGGTEIFRFNPAQLERVKTRLRYFNFPVEL